MGVGGKMGDERTRADNHEIKQDVEVLGLKDDEHPNNQVERHEDVINHARPDFVKHALAAIVDNSHQCQKSHPTEDQQLVKRDMLILEQRLEMGDADEVGNERIKAAGIDGYSRQKPVGRNDSKERCPHHSPAECHQLEAHHQPQEWNEEQYLDEQQAGDA